MKVEEVPKSPAYLVSHDLWMDGAMDVWGVKDLQFATVEAERRNRVVDDLGGEGDTRWRAYEELPDLEVWAFRGFLVRRGT